MKKAGIAWMLLMACILIAGCCNKKDCEGAEEITEIHLQNFSANEVDTLIWIRYEKSSGFTSPVDSLTASAVENGTAFVHYLHSNLDLSYDYQIKLPATGAVYQLTEFKTASEACNDCFPFRPRNAYYLKLSSYEVNGIRQNGEQIIIYK